MGSHVNGKISLLVRELRLFPSGVALQGKRLERLAYLLQTRVLGEPKDRVQCGVHLSARVNLCVGAHV